MSSMAPHRIINTTLKRFLYKILPRHSINDQKSKATPRITALGLPAGYTQTSTCYYVAVVLYFRYINYRGPVCAAYAICMLMSVGLFVCLSKVGVLSKRIQLSSRNQTNLSVACIVQQWQQVSNQRTPNKDMAVWNQPHESTPPVCPPVRIGVTSTSESLGVNRHSMRCSMLVVWQRILVSRWEL